MKYGADGYALYWLCLELIAAPIDKLNVSFELEHDAEILAHRLKIDTLRVQEIMKYMVEIRLFEINQSTNRIICLKLANRLDESSSKNPEIRAAVNRFRAEGLIDSSNFGLAYLIKSNDKYKIGRTTNLHRRLSDYATTNPDATLLHSIETVDAGLLESTLHREFKSKRIGKTEWFRLADSDVESIKSIKSGDHYIEFGMDSETFPIVSGAEEIRLDKIRLDKKVTNTSEPQAGSNTRISKSDHEMVIGIYHQVLPELSGVLISRWHGSSHAKQLSARWREDSKFRTVEFWTAFFETVRLNNWWMGVADQNGGACWDKCNLAWLVKRENFDKVLAFGMSKAS